jgi:hypothetical protein
MLNISPDTLFQWSGGCWTAILAASQGSQAKVNQDQSAAPRLAPPEKSAGQSRGRSKPGDENVSAVPLSAKAA